MVKNKKQSVRRRFREAVFKRARYCCECCGIVGRDAQGGDSHRQFHNLTAAASAELDAHHITNRNEMPHGGYVAENGIAVCAACHLKAEVFWSTGNAEPGFAPADLYSQIGASYEEAVSACESRLG